MGRGGERGFIISLSGHLSSSLGQARHRKFMGEGKKKKKKRKRKKEKEEREGASWRIWRAMEKGKDFFDWTSRKKFFFFFFLFFDWKNVIAHKEKKKNKNKKIFF
jgi:hypothetical protein